MDQSLRIKNISRNITIIASTGAFERRRRGVGAFACTIQVEASNSTSISISYLTVVETSWLFLAPCAVRQTLFASPVISRTSFFNNALYPVLYRSRQFSTKRRDPLPARRNGLARESEERERRRPILAYRHQLFHIAEFSGSAQHYTQSRI